MNKVAQDRTRATPGGAMTNTRLAEFSDSKSLVGDGAEQKGEKIGGLII